MRFSNRVPSNLRPNRLAEARAGLGEIPFDLTVSNPTACGFTYPDDLLMPLSDPLGLSYEPHPRGPLPAREAVAAGYDRYSEVIDPRRVVLTASTSEAYSLLIKLVCDPGDTVVVPTPSYPLFDQLTRIDAVRTHLMALDPEDDWRPILDDLAAAPSSTRAVVLVHPNNPTGSFVHPEDAGAIAGACRDRRWALVVDEVFLPFGLDGGPGENRSFARRSDALTFTLGGLSKSLGLPQLKLAWIVVGGPDDLVAAALERLDYIADAYLSVSTPVALAAPRLLATADSMTEVIGKRCRANLATLREVASSFPAASIPGVGGGWSIPIRLPAVMDDEILATRLLEERGVAVQPGFFFDFPRDATLVLSLLTPEDIWKEGIETLFDACRSWF